MNKLIIWLIVIALVVVVAGAIINFAQPGRPLSQQCLSATPPILKAIQQNMVSMFVNGTVSKIDGTKVTISSQKNSVVVNFKDNIVINTAPAPGAKKPASLEPLGLKDLKTGDTVYSSFKLLSNNTFEGISLTIVPQPAK